MTLSKRVSHTLQAKVEFDPNRLTIRYTTPMRAVLISIPSSGISFFFSKGVPH